jgi:hypothetical protein
MTLASSATSAIVESLAVVVCVATQRDNSSCTLYRLPRHGPTLARLGLRVGRSNHELTVAVVYLGELPYERLKLLRNGWAG